MNKVRKTSIHRTSKEFELALILAKINQMTNITDIAKRLDINDETLRMRLRKEKEKLK